MSKQLLRSWYVGLAISVIGLILSFIVNTTVGMVGVLISAPAMIAGEKLFASADKQVSASLLSLLFDVIVNSAFYGILIYIGWRVRANARRRRTSPRT